MKLKQGRFANEKSTAEKLLDGNAHSPKWPSSELHPISEDMSNESDRAKVIDKNECFLCHGIGHWARECTSLPKIYLGDSPPICYSCGGEGHFARVCPSTYKIRPVKYATSTAPGSELELSKPFNFRRHSINERSSDHLMLTQDALHSHYAMYDMNSFAYSHPCYAVPFQPYFTSMYDYGVPYPVVATSEYYDPQAFMASKDDQSTMYGSADADRLRAEQDNKSLNKVAPNEMELHATPKSEGAPNVSPR